MQSEKMVKQPWKRSLALLLAVLCLLPSVLVAASALANGSSGHWKDDPPKFPYHYKFTNAKETFGLQHNNPWGQAEKLIFTSNGVDQLAYCMELGSQASTATTTVTDNAGSIAGYLHPSTNLTQRQKQRFIELALIYGYTGTTKYNLTADATEAHNRERYATQIMIWMIASGDSATSGISNESVFNQYSTGLNDLENSFITHCLASGASSGQITSIRGMIAKMKEQMVNHGKYPSFMTDDSSKASTKICQLNYNPATGYYENVTTLIDNNGVAAYYTCKTNGVEFVRNGNEVKIRTKKIIPANAPLTVTAERTGAQYVNPVYIKLGAWDDPGKGNKQGQPGCVSLSGGDPMKAYMTVWTNAVGSIRIIKKAPDGTAKGVKFTVTGPAYPNGTTVTTGEDGTFPLWNIQPGTYTVKEIVTEGQICTSQNPQTVTVTAGKTSEVTFENRWQKFIVELSKYDAEKPDKRLSGAVFHAVVTKGSWRGESDMTEVDGSPGLFRHGPTAYGATITITETKAPVGYVPLEKPIVIQLNNETIQKYGVKDTTNPDNDWIIKVKLDENGNLSPDGVEGVPNTPIKYNLKIVKKDGETQTPLKGAQFNLYETQGYDAKNPPGTAKLVASAVTDASGELTFKNIRYGQYILRETQAPTGYVSDRWFSAGIPILLMEVQNGSTFTYEATNEMIRGHLKIVKKDAGAVTIPLEGAGFRVYSAAKDNVSGEEVSREGYTNADGEITFRDLPYGKYTYQEIEAPKGYQLNETVYDFNIAEQGVTITKNAFNRRLPGSISVHKTDDSGKPLAGVKFLLAFSMDGATWLPVQRAPILSGSANVVPGGCTSPGLQNGVLVTDEDGNAVFSGLFTSIGTSRILYRLTELETLDGYQLLSEPVFEGALKIGEEIDVSFTVVNTHTYVLPPTGSIGYCLMTAVAGVFAVGAIGCIVVLCKKRRKIY